MSVPFALAVASPDQRLRLVLRADDETPLSWAVYLDNTPVIEPSDLALELETGATISDVAVTTPSHAQVFSIDRPAGKKRQDQAPAVVAELELHVGITRMALDVAVFDDAIAHRFRFIEAPVEVVADRTSFAFAAESRKFVQAYDRASMYAPASEALYTADVAVDFVLPSGDSWSFPALFDTPNGWCLVGESGVGAHSDGSRLVNDQTAIHVMAPPLDDQPHGPPTAPPTAPYALPWKVAVVSDDLARVVATSAFEFMADPPAIGDTSWIRPGRVAWSWWSDSASPRNPETLRRFIDFAAEVRWEYSLIDANWNQMPQGTIEDLVAYGRERDVGLFLWYNSGGSHNQVTEEPRDRMTDASRRRSELAWLADIGVVGLKVDFFNNDRASINNLALEILADTAEFELLANFHGITAPKGWHATWPHLLTTEAVRGAEQYKFDPWFPATAARHNTLLPFTRNVVGPMDYTPITVSDVDFAHETTNAHELALGVIFESGLQHPADSPDAYRSLGREALDYLRRLPVVWDELRLVTGAPGDVVVLARRHHDEWWLGGINGNPGRRTVEVDLGEFGRDFNLVRDVSEAPRQIDASVVSGAIQVTMEPFGGFVAWPVNV